MVRLHPSVDEQLAEFETTIQNFLINHLNDGINMEFWHEMDALDVESIQGIFLTFDMAFTTMMERYRFAPSVLGALKAAKILMRSCVNVAMNTFFPHGVDPVEYINRVIRNTMEVYYENIYIHLRNEIIMSNHSAHVIQRSFRYCVSNPNHTMCIQKLNREFEEDSEQLRALASS